MSTPLNPHQFGYHYSDPANRESIDKHGLLPGGNHDHWPAGVYFATDRARLNHPTGADVYRIDLTGLEHRADPLLKHARYVPGAVEPKRITRLGEGEG